MALAGRDERPIPHRPDAEAGAAGRPRRDARRDARDLRIAHAELAARTRPSAALGPVGARRRCSSSATPSSEATDADPSHRVAEHGVTLRPDLRRARPAHEARCRPCCSSTATPHGTALDRPLAGERWAATPIDRAVELARASGVPLALVTDGAALDAGLGTPGRDDRHVHLAQRGVARGAAHAAGVRRRCSALAASSASPSRRGSPALLQESAGKQQEVADQLGAQVRRAVELLIATLDREDRDRHGELLQATPRRRGLPRRVDGDDAARLPVRRRGAPAAADRRSALRRDARGIDVARSASRAS